MHEALNRGANSTARTRQLRHRLLVILSEYRLLVVPLDVHHHLNIRLVTDLHRTQLRIRNDRASKQGQAQAAQGLPCVIGGSLSSRPEDFGLCLDRPVEVSRRREGRSLHGVEGPAHGGGFRVFRGATTVQKAPKSHMSLGHI